MAKKIITRTFDEVLADLGNRRFDVAPASGGAKSLPAGAKASEVRPGSGAVRVSKYGCAAEIAPTGAKTVAIVVHPGFVLGGEISTLLDRGYQKFLKTSRIEIAATADHLRAVHQFSEELREAAGIPELYNQALGTTSDLYVYDRLKGRPDSKAGLGNV